MKKNVLHGLIAGALTVGAGLCTPVYAADTDDMGMESYTLDDVIVTASRSNTQIADIPADVTLISAAQIERGNYKSVSDALAGANINVVKKGFAAYPIINGDTRVLVLPREKFPARSTPSTVHGRSAGSASLRAAATRRTGSKSVMRTRNGAISTTKTSTATTSSSPPAPLISRPLPQATSTPSAMTASCWISVATRGTTDTASICGIRGSESHTTPRDS